MGSIEVSMSAGPFRRIWLLVIACLLLVTATVPRCQAQTWAEWFKQGKTQKKYLLNQIAALQVYIGYAKKGYDLVGTGLRTVKDITSGEFSLHHAFISGLKQVNPAIRDDVRIAEILVLQVGILRGFSGMRHSDFLNADQLLYIAEVGNELISACYQDLSELLLVITSGKLEMKDDERLLRLEGIYQRMLEKSAFSRDFCEEANILIAQKKLEQGTLEKLRRYYGLE